MTAVVDMYPETFRRGYRRELLILGMSIFSFFVGLIMCMEVGLSSVYSFSIYGNKCWLLKMHVLLFLLLERPLMHVHATRCVARDRATLFL